MLKTGLCGLIAAGAAVLAASAAERARAPIHVSPALVQKIAALQPRIGARARALIAQEGAQIVSQGRFSLVQIRTDVEAADLGAQGGGDIDALVQLSLLQAAVDAESDLRGQLNVLQITLAQRRAARALSASMRRSEQAIKAQAAGEAAKSATLAQPPPPPVYTLDSPQMGLASLDQRIATDQTGLQSLDDGATPSTRLQARIERLTGLETLLSNLLIAADTATAMTGNLK